MLQTMEVLLQRNSGLVRLLGRKAGGENEEADRFIGSVARQASGVPEAAGESRSLGGHF